MPHKIGNLWDQIASYDALLEAWRDVRKGKGTKTPILRYESNLAVNLSRLEYQLQSGKYKPREHYSWKIVLCNMQFVMLYAYRYKSV